MQVAEMAVYCTRCGEELLGSVNRCWKCGQDFVARRGDAGLPPVRRAPVETSVLVAQIADDDREVGDAAEPPGQNVSAPDPIRRGSPFANRGTSTIEQLSPVRAGNRVNERARQPDYPKNGGAAVGAILTFPIGLIALLAGFLFPIGGLILAAAGIALGTWGLYSPRRGTALAGLLLCSLCLAVAGCNGAIELYEQMYGVKPWETANPLTTP